MQINLLVSFPSGVDQDAIGFPNVQTSANSSVEGALYLLKTEELAMVDGHMGYPEVRQSQGMCNFTPVLIKKSH